MAGGWQGGSAPIGLNHALAPVASLLLRNFGKISNQSHSFNAIIRPLKDIGNFKFDATPKSRKK